jgi:hypothetical protein
MAKASDNPFPSVLVVEGSAPASPSAGNQRLFVDTADHKLKRVNSSGTVTTVEGGGTGFAPKVKWLNYSTQDIKVATTSFVAFTNSAGTSLGTALDLTLSSSEVTVGDTIEVGFGGVWKNEARDGFVTFGTLVSSSIVNTIYGSAKGIPGSYGAASAYSNAGGSAFYVVQSGDLSSGALTVRPVGKVSSAGDKTILAASPDTVVFWVKNWGPQ